MKKMNPLEFQTGLLMGVVFGFLFEISLIYLYNNLICKWLGWNPFTLIWWMYLPIPLFFGLRMGFSIANLHLEDY